MIPRHNTTVNDEFSVYTKNSKQLHTNGHSAPDIPWNDVNESSIPLALGDDPNDWGDTAGAYLQVRTLDADGDPVAGLMARYVAIPADKLRSALLADVGQLAGLDRAQLERLLAGLAISERWIAQSLRPAIREQQRTDAPTVASLRPTWRDYASAAESLGYSFRLNTLANRVEANGEPLDDVTEAQLLVALHERGLGSADLARRAFITRAAQDRYHPVHEYLHNLRWDGRDHIAHLCSFFSDIHSPITYADGQQRTVFHAFLRRWLVGAIAKSFNPKQYQNSMLILDGAQGRGKSYFVEWLCPVDGLHITAPIKPDDKDYYANLTTKFVWEVGELGSTIRRADRESLKLFLTTQEATYRPAYGRYVITKPALASCIGTVNMEQGFLNDPTGNRRFWPLTLSNIDWGYKGRVDLNQLWAHAYALYIQGESPALSPEEGVTHAEVCELYQLEDPHVARIMRLFDIVPADALTDEARQWFMSWEDVARVMSGDGARWPSERAAQMEIGTSLQWLKIERVIVRGKPTRRGYIGIRKKPESIGTGNWQ